jgi:microcystin-dependent protein
MYVAPRRNRRPDRHLQTCLEALSHKPNIVESNRFLSNQVDFRRIKSISVESNQKKPKMEKTLGNFTSQPNRDFPLDCETLAALQDNAALAAILGNIAGDKTILAGCEVAGTNRTAGYVFLRTADFPDGEVLRFAGGSATLGFYLKKEAVSVTAFDVEYPQAYIRRSLAPGVGGEHFNWADFRHIATNAALSDKNAAQDAAIAALTPPPIGIVQLFAGAENKIPANYMLCDGRTLATAEYAELYAVIGRAHTPGTVGAGLFRLPDLRGRFVVGFNADDTDYNAVAKTGGEKKHALTEPELAPHVHRAKKRPGRSDGGFVVAAGPATAKSGSDGRGLDEASRHYPQETESAGSGAAHENRPPYYVLIYIMRVK